MGLRARAGSGQRFETVYFDAHHILIMAISVFLFRGFEGMSMKTNGTVNALAAHCFGVYLIHDSNYLRYPLWQGLLGCADFAGSEWLVPYSAACVAGVFCLCAGLEFLRRRVFELFTKKRVKSPDFS